MRLPRPRSSPDTLDQALRALALAAVLAFCFFGAQAEWVICPFRRLTGLPCPLCGLTRAVGAIAHGRFREAVELHALSPLVFVLIAGGLLSCMLRLAGRTPPQAGIEQSRVIGFLAILFLVYGGWRILASSV